MQAVDARLKQADRDATTYNSRESLLGLPISDYTGVKKLQEQFDPFVQFWTVAHAFKASFFARLPPHADDA